jgi:hypothetical protein
LPKRKGKRKKEEQKDLIHKSITEETGSKSNTQGTLAVVTRRS